jgi:hypothetical protein
LYTKKLLEAVHVNASPANVIILGVFVEANLFEHAYSMKFSSSVYERPVRIRFYLVGYSIYLSDILIKSCCLPIKRVTVVARYHLGLHLNDVIKEASYESFLVGLIEDNKVTGKLGLGRKVKVGHVLGYDLTVRDEIASTVHHVGDHHDLIGSGVGKFQRQLGCLNVIGQHDRIWSID